MSSPHHGHEKSSSSAWVKPAQTESSHQLETLSPTLTETRAPQPNEPASESPSAGDGSRVRLVSPVQAAATSVLPGAAATDVGGRIGHGAGPPSTSTLTASKAEGVGNSTQSQAVPEAPGAQASRSQPATTYSPPPDPRRAQSDNAHHADLLFSRDKRQRPAALAQRQSGSSLITQALAFARGIPQSQQPRPLTPPTLAATSIEASRKPPFHPRHLGAPIGGRAGDGPSAEARPYDAPDNEDDGGSLTPRASLRSSPAAMAVPASPTTSTAILSQTNILQSPSTYDVETNSIGTINQDHRALLDALGLGKPLKRLDKESKAGHGHASMHGQRHGSNFADQDAAHAGQVAGQAAGQVRGRVGVIPSRSEASLDEDQSSSTCPKRLEHRFSMGPEKMWSIETDSEIGGGSEGGQVEKSIKEAMAKSEHAARSRKTSHTLGFFKEGNPGEASKRKDTKRSVSTWDKSPPGLEHLAEGGRSSAKEKAKDADSDETRSDAVSEGDLTPTLQRSSAFPSPPPLLSKSYSFDPTSPDAGDHPRADIDPCRQDGPGGDIDMSEKLLPEIGPTSLPRPEPAVRETEGQLRYPSDGSTEIGDSAEDGDDSGEEKISSAFFLPHQGLDESGDQGRDEATAAGPSCASRSLSRSQDDYPWLVKAGQREPEGQTSPAAGPSSPRLEDTPRLGDDFAIVDEPEIVLPSVESSRPVSFFDDPRHEHQLSAKQPLPAIELIPYRHQVGGHTTLWRFSKRAVCKQLNNRENEFYETVERFHRDLLPFLPRYIGVLNVTFQKQRRKSTFRKEDGGGSERKTTSSLLSSTGGQADAADTATKVSKGSGPAEGQRVVSQSIASSAAQVPTVTFDDNRHILPRNLLQPNAAAFANSSRRSPASFASGSSAQTNSRPMPFQRPSLDERAHSWGATMVNKKLRNEVFNDAFLKQPVAIEKHRRPHQRPIPRPSAASHMLKSANSDTQLMTATSMLRPGPGSEPEPFDRQHLQPHAYSKGMVCVSDNDSGYNEPGDQDVPPEPKDISGTSAPEPGTMAETFVTSKRKRRFSGSGLRRKPPAVSEPRGNLKYFEGADEAGSKDKEILSTFGTPNGRTTHEALDLSGASCRSPKSDGMVASPLQSEDTAVQFKVPRPVNPKEAQVQRDKRVEHFLLLEDLTAGMKKPCVMDLKMGTRQYGVDATAKKQASQKGKCARTTSRELGVRVCGLQVWDVAKHDYVFRDKYVGRKLKAGKEFKDALARFLYNGADYYSMLRHIPTILQKLDKLERIVRTLNGYRFYAASLLMFYDGEASAEASGNETAIDDSTTDAATDAEEASSFQITKKKNKGEIDFKIADFANSITARSELQGRPCPPQHPNEPDRGFLRGLRTLRKYFLEIQRDIRAELGIETYGRTLAPEDMIDEDEDSVSE